MLYLVSGKFPIDGSFNQEDILFVFTEIVLPHGFRVWEAVLWADGVSQWLVQNGLFPVMVAAERRGIFTFSLALSHCCLPSQPVLVYSLHTAQNSMQDSLDCLLGSLCLQYTSTDTELA